MGQEETLITQVNLAVYIKDNSTFTKLGYLQTTYKNPGIESFHCAIITDKNDSTKWDIQGIDTDETKIWVHDQSSWGYWCYLGYETVNIPSQLVVVMRGGQEWSYWQFVGSNNGQPRLLEITSYEGKGNRIYGSRALGRYLLLGKDVVPGLRELYFAVEQ